MRRKVNTIPLTADEIEELTKICQVMDVQKDQHIIHEGHVPNVAYLVLDGEVVFAKRNKPFASLANKSVFGAHELMDHTKFKYSAKAKAGSKLVILDRSTLKEILDDMDHLAYEALADHLPYAQSS